MDSQVGLYNSAPIGKANYRSIGRGTGGVAVSAKRNCHWRDPDWPTTPSIPAKFETVLYRGNKEDRGFGSGGPRFGQESRQSELPGPGTHHNSAAFAIMDTTVGKRGHGAFASRAPREKPPKSARAPGPGAYCASSGLPPPASQRASAAFVNPASVNPAKFNARAAPGPGDYSGAVGPQASIPGAKAVDGRGAAMSHAGELGDTVSHSVKTATPGPGAYADRVRSNSEEPTQRERIPRLSKRQLAQQAESPHKGLSENALLRLTSGLLGEETIASARVVPGPGQYDPKTEVTSGGGHTSFSTGESQSFRIGKSHLPRRWREQSPGPGYYEAPPSPTRQTGVPAFAASNTERFGDKVPLAPGPAFYSPRKRPESDFHLNAKEMWM